jgi:uncharacterized protein (DUF1684 family)
LNVGTTIERANAAPSTYEADILAWRQQVETDLRAEDSWLTLTGLYWLREGENTVGSDPVSDVLLAESAPQRLGVIELHDGTVTLRVTTDAEVSIGGEAAKTATLRNDYDPQGLTRVVVGSVSFYVVKRADQYGIRVRDARNPARLAFAGRNWFPVDARYRITASYTAYPEPTKLDTATIVGIDIEMDNPGFVTFTLDGHKVRLEAFSGSNGQIWFVFKDTSPQTYQAGRFLYTTVNPDGTALLDFNKAYNPPCAFTPYATCPLPPQQNVLAFRIEAGEIVPEALHA